ncbi:MAG: hypothetical protein JXM70_05765 [Pirellulales bacterium]|nr:hypothetical protein [Pirellulales bacterium]
MSENKFVRKQIFVDPKVQGSLIFRVIAYWTVCVLTISIMLLCWRMLTGPARPPLTHLDDMWFKFGPALIASFILLPLVIYDIVKISNRFTGPLLRLRRCMRALAAGEEVKPIRFREGDFWQDLAKDFNAVAARVQNGEVQRTEDGGQGTEGRGQEAEEEQAASV